MLSLKYYFTLFIIYSFLGWILELIWTSITQKKLINRGFLIGPYCPIYGIGCLLLILLLDNHKNNISILFLMTIIICSIVEYTISYILEKLFKARWWDYSHYKYNLNGRICLETMIPFGILGTIVIYYLNPFIADNININNHLIPIIFITFLIDIITSFIIIKNIKNTIKKRDLDNTEEITKKVKETLKKFRSI